jgi:hypothetical protein
MIRWWPVLLVLVLALTGCPFDRQAHADPVQAVLGQDFVLPGGQQAVLEGENVRLRFTEVLEDSRCPTKVECFWTGQARIVIAVQVGDSAPTNVEFNTNPAPGQNRQTVPVGQYVVELKKLDPYPETPDDSPALADYRATLLVRRG